MTLERSSLLRKALLAAPLLCGLLLASAALSRPKHPAAPSAKPDAAASQEAFLQVYKVLESPRCANCHPAGDAPLQGDDSHVHQQFVKRGVDGHGAVAMRCQACHQEHNLPGDNMPPGNPKWSLPSPEHKMVFVGRSAAALCAQIKDPKQNGGRGLEQLYDHIAHDDLVGWAWNPGDGRTLPPLTRDETAKQFPRPLPSLRRQRLTPSSNKQILWGAELQLRQNAWTNRGL